MDHDYLLELKRTHPTLRLLSADTAPLMNHQDLVMINSKDASPGKVQIPRVLFVR